MMKIVCLHGKSGCFKVRYGNRRDECSGVQRMHVDKCLSDIRFNTSYSMVRLQLGPSLHVRPDSKCRYTKLVSIPMNDLGLTHQ
jgi:hypothetical protein